MLERPSPPTTPAAPEIIWPVAALACVAAVAWLVPTTVAWLHDGSGVAVLPAVKGTVALVGHSQWAHPALAYPPDLRQHMPTDGTWWVGAGWVLTTLALFAYGSWRTYDRRASLALLGRTGGIAGSRPRSWALRRDVRALHSRRTSPSRFTLGRLNGRLLASDPEAHVAVIAPTRSGKTTRYVIPWLLEHDGPAIVTSTKTDVLNTTRAWREKLGRVSVWDPFGQDSCLWTPLTGCNDWQYALCQAQWLADAAQQGDSEIATYWRGEAARLLAPLLHAAALADGHIEHVLQWIDTQETKHPAGVLNMRGAKTAGRQLTGISALDSRNRGTVYMSAGSLLAAYRLPAVRSTARPGLAASEFLNGEPNTLYIVASSRQQRLLAPLIVALLSSLLNSAAEQANREGALDPPLRVLLDETANVAPLRDLPAHLSQAAGHGIRMATIWQSIAQAHQRYGASADEILANSTAQIYLGPVTDHTTRRHIVDLLGDENVDTASVNTGRAYRSQTTSRTRRPKASADALQQLAADRALLVEGRHSPAVIESIPYWRQHRLRRRVVHIP